MKDDLVLWDGLSGATSKTCKGEEARHGEGPRFLIFDFLFTDASH
jgi:hypothetical protein